MSVTLSAVSVRVPAKVNIQLEVGALRPDGFHELRTVFHAVDLCDTVIAARSDALELSLTGPESAGLPAGEGNLAWRAACALAEHAGIAARANLSVHKAIPVAAGLAGGSADAAGALLACDLLWGLRTGTEELARLGAGLGSDVSFALLGGTAEGTGRGERLAEITDAGGFHWVLALAEGQLSTPDVYAELDRHRAGAHCAARKCAEPAGALTFGPHNAETAQVMAAALRSEDPRRLAPLLSNDLQSAALALAPYLEFTLRTGQELGALAGLVSGSGPTCAFLARDRADAEQLADRLPATGTCRSAYAVIGGAPGAEIIGETVVP